MNESAFSTDSIFMNIQDFHIPKITGTDVAEVIIIAFFLFQILVWIKNTRAWSVLKAVIIVLLFVLFAWSMDMTTIIWIMQALFSIAATAIIVVLQPELRKGLEELGRSRFFAFLFLDLFKSTEAVGRFSDHTAAEIVRASMEMGRVKTGALIVIEGENSLLEFDRTGIRLDAEVSSQLLINIFEKNTPLHDGAVLIKGDRITSATCYLPLSESRLLSKDLGTRHRAAVGISEVTDSLTVIVSEETGNVSIAYGGALSRVHDSEDLRKKLDQIQNKNSSPDVKNRPRLFRKRNRLNNE